VKHILESSFKLKQLLFIGLEEVLDLTRWFWMLILNQNESNRLQEATVIAFLLRKTDKCLKEISYANSSINFFFHLVISKFIFEIKYLIKEYTWQI